MAWPPVSHQDVQDRVAALRATVGGSPAATWPPTTHGHVTTEIAALRTAVGGTASGWPPTTHESVLNEINALWALANTATYATSFGTPQHEDGAIYTYPNTLTFGAVNVAPLATAPASKGVDVIAHWYNDFGLDYVALSSSSANGWYGWYDWQWNFPTNTGNGTTTLGYDMARHPIQGFYKGDNARVLDWQCNWMVTAGVDVISVVQAGQGFNTTNWTSSSAESYWVWQLFNNCPNFQLMKYVLWMRSSGTSTQIQAQNDDMVAQYAAASNGYTRTEGGLDYAVVYCWDMEAIRGVYDAFNGQTNTVAYLKGLATKFRNIGYDGVMILCRNGSLVTQSLDSTLLAAGVIPLYAEYENRYGTDASFSNSYSNYANNCVFPTATNRVLNVVTAAKTQYPHGTGWTLAGHTPALFGTVVNRATAAMVANGQRRMLTIYNVSEWAEGGPGLIPNKQDQFGYLEALRTMTAR